MINRKSDGHLSQKESVEVRLERGRKLKQELFQKSKHARKYFNCKKCFDIFYCESSLKAHLCAQKKSFTCKKCLKQFDFEGRFIEHVNRGHKRCYTCEVCQSKFLFKSSVIIHRRTHDLKPCICDVCQEAFALEANLRCHLIEKHGVNPDDILKGEPFTCELCQMKFPLEKDLYTHFVFNHHKDCIRGTSCEAFPEKSIADAQVIAALSSLKL